MENWGKLGIIGAALFGGGYAISGERDFEVVVHQPADEVYSAFSSARNFNGGFRNAGYAEVRVRTERPSDTEIVYLSGEPGDEKSMRIALTITPGDSANQAVVTAAIDVPPVRYEIDGDDLILSETKVENVLEKNIASIAQKLSMGRDAQSEFGEFRNTLDMVALATDSDAVERFDNQRAPQQSPQSGWEQESEWEQDQGW